MKYVRCQDSRWSGLCVATFFLRVFTFLDTLVNLYLFSIATLYIPAFTQSLQYRFSSGTPLAYTLSATATQPHIPFLPRVKLLDQSIASLSLDIYALGILEGILEFCDHGQVVSSTGLPRPPTERPPRAVRGVLFGALLKVPDSSVLHSPAYGLSRYQQPDANSLCSQSKLSPTQLDELQRATHFDKKELQQWYKGRVTAYVIRSHARDRSQRTIQDSSRIVHRAP